MKTIRTHNKEWSMMFSPSNQSPTGMNADEAMEIVLRLARSLETDDTFEWEAEYSEACGIVDIVKERIELLD